MRTVWAVWSGLVAITILSWLVGGDEEALSDAQLASVIVLIAAFVKVRLIARYFMEARLGPRGSQLALDGWCSGVCIAMIGVYLIV